MSLTSKPAAYRDCYDLFDKAISTPGGVRAPIATYNAARIFQLRMNKARSIERDFNRRAYDRASPLYDTSPWDGYAVCVRGPDAAGEWWIYVEPTGNDAVVAAAEPIDPSAAITRPMIDITPTSDPRHAQPRLPSPEESADLD